MGLVEIFLMGGLTGSRALTPMAMLCWFLYVGKMSVRGTWAEFAGALATAIIFSVMAFGELIGDKQAKAPSRLAPLGLVARMLMGGLVGAIVSLQVNVRLSLGVTLGIVGAAAGAFAFHTGRRCLAEAIGKDWPAALMEDAVAIGGAFGVLALTCARFS